MRGSFPDLPSSETVSRAVRTPLSFLDDLADSHDTGPEGPGTATHEDTDEPTARWPDRDGRRSGRVATVASPDGVGSTRCGRVGRVLRRIPE